MVTVTQVYFLVRRASSNSGTSSPVIVSSSSVRMSLANGVTFLGRGLGRRDKSRGGWTAASDLSLTARALEMSSLAPMIEMYRNCKYWRCSEDLKIARVLYCL